MARLKPKLKEKRWNFKEKEPQLVEKWIKEKIYAFDPKTKGEIFSIDTPPPYASGAWHMGGAAHYSQIDMIARYRRMCGYNVLFPMGIDRNGLPIEVETEKHFNISIHETPRDEFIEKCKVFLDNYGLQITNTAKRLGLSCNSWTKGENLGDLYETDDPRYRALTQATFIELYKKGLIYEDTKPNNWCPGCGTTLADAEIEYKEENTGLYYIKFKTDDEDIIVATTRPELLPACAAIIYNPSDERYSHLEGKKATVPLFDKEIPILPHPYAKPEFGTGLVMICSFGDQADIRLFRELNLKPTYVIGLDGKMNKNCKGYEGLPVKEARKKIVEDLKKANLLVKEEQILHRAPICWRSKDHIEFVELKEYYLKQEMFVEDIKKIAENIKWYAPVSKQRLLDWLQGIKMDWVISRRRYYGTEIPLWYCKNCGETILPKPGKYYQPWKDPAPVEKCPKCGGVEFEPETRIFDTWMDSSISELYILGYKYHNDFFKKHFPCTLRPNGKDIIRTWTYYTLLRAYQLFKKPAFKEIWISHHVVDEHGRKMSKSLGNIVDPQEVIEKYGSDSLRFWSCIEGNFLEDDLRCNLERIEGASKFLTKFWNIARFISMFPIPKKPTKLQPTDEWILSELDQVIKRSLKGYEEYNFNIPAVEIRNFTWNILASHYLEMVKDRAYNSSGQYTDEESNSARYTMHEILKILLLLLAPIVPFITETIWMELYGETSIHLEKMPKPLDIKRDAEVTKTLMEFNSLVWKIKKDSGKSLKEALSSATIPSILEPFSSDLKAMHNINDLRIGEKIDLKL